MILQSKLPNIGSTIFSTMSQLAVTHNAINLGQGFPDFNPDKQLIQYVTDAMLNGHNQYPPMPGVPDLREQIAKKVLDLYGRSYDDASEITVTSGATEALMTAILATVGSGDEVIVIEPFYDLYIPAIELAGGKPVIVPLSAPDESRPTYQVDWNRIEQSVGPKTRMIILNFPHNPTGINLKPADLDELEKIVADTGILLLSDEAYEHIVFDGRRHHSLASRPLLAEHAFVVSSFGKTYHTTGWKVGYCCAPAGLTKEFRKVHQFVVFTVSSPMQVGLSRYMQDPKPYLELSAYYQKKRDRLTSGLAKTRFEPLPSEGTFFLLARYDAISSMSELEFANWLTVEHGVTVIPVSAFYEDPAAPSSNHHLVRFCFAKQDQTLDAAIAKLQKV